MRRAIVLFVLSLVVLPAAVAQTTSVSEKRPDAADAPVRGTVKAIRGEFVVVDMSHSEWLPIGGIMSRNRPIQIGFEVPGVGVVTSDEKWLVSQINRDSFEIRAPSPAALASVRPGYTVLVPRLTASLQTKAQYDKGHADYERWASMQWTGAMAAFARYEAFDAAWRIGDFDTALEVAPKVDVGSLDPEVGGNFELAVAEILDARGRLEEAEAHFRKAVALNPRMTAFFACNFFAEHDLLDRGREICDTCLQVDRLSCSSIPGVAPKQ